MPTNEPLNKADLTAIKGYLRQLHDFQSQLSKAKNCGVNCDDYEQHRNYLIDQLESLRKTYFPGEE